MPTHTAETELTSEITKLVLSSNVSFLQGTTQVVQAVTTLLFTSYLAWLHSAVGNELAKMIPWVLLVLPVVCWGAGILMIFMNTILYSYRGTPFTVGDLESTVAAYEQMLQRRRRIVLLPTLLTLVGLTVMAGLFLWYT